MLDLFRALSKNHCTILHDISPICCVAWKTTCLDMQPSMRLADAPNPGAIRHDYFLPRHLGESGTERKPGRNRQCLTVQSELEPSQNIKLKWSQNKDKQELCKS
jgi:hypothetical protein